MRCFVRRCAGRAAQYLLLVLLSVFPAGLLRAGNVYFARHESQANARVFVVDNESEADLCVRLVCQESQGRDVDEFWHYVPYESRADVKVFFVAYESQADIRVFFVANDSQAGWRRENPFQGRFK